MWVLPTQCLSEGDKISLMNVLDMHKDVVGLAVKSMLMHAAAMQIALMEMLSMDRELDHVSLEFRRIGTNQHALLVSPDSSMGLVRARTLRLACRHGCHVQVERGSPLGWLNFSLVSEGAISLSFDGCLDFLHGLQDFELFCCSFCGPACVELTQALALLGRSVHSGGDCRGWWLNTFKHGRRSEAFNQLMLCGCHACLNCLEADAKLSEGSILPDDGQLQHDWRFPLS